MIPYNQLATLAESPIEDEYAEMLNEVDVLQPHKDGVFYQGVLEGLNISLNTFLAKQYDNPTKIKLLQQIAVLAARRLVEAHSEEDYKLGILAEDLNRNLNFKELFIDTLADDKEKIMTCECGYRGTLTQCPKCEKTTEGFHV